MATDQASVSSSPENATDHARTSPRQLWQVPVFLLGVLAVVGVWAARPYWQGLCRSQLGCGQGDYLLAALRRGGSGRSGGAIRAAGGILLTVAVPRPENGP